MKGIARKAVAYAEAHGYRFERTNSKGCSFYRSDSGHEVPIYPGANEAQVRMICTQIDRACGVGPDTSQKRKPDQIRLRAEQQRERERLHRLAEEKRRELLAGAGALLSRHEVNLIARQIEDYERRIREIENLMRAGSNA